MSETVATSLLCLLLLLLAAGFAVGGVVLVAMAGASGESPLGGQSGWSAWLLPVAYATLLLSGAIAPVTMRLLGFGWVAVGSTAAGCFFAAVALLVIGLAAHFGQ